jgi:hypothetical protein
MWIQGQVHMNQKLSNLSHGFHMKKAFTRTCVWKVSLLLNRLIDLSYWRFNYEQPLSINPKSWELLAIE